MKYISPTFLGEGWQYRVVASQKGRVIKERHGVWKMMHLIFFSSLKSLSFLKTPWKAGEMREASDRSLWHLMTLDPKAMQVLGNPNIVSPDRYEQDLMVPMGSLLAGKSKKEAEALFTLWADSVYQTWQLGICETTFKFDSNYGLAADGTIALLDLGELVFTFQEADTIVKKCAWKNAYIPRSLTVYKSTFFEVCDAMFTPTILEKQWKNDVIGQTR